ncbi:hypothetical protein P3T18_000179 [Paraburkholderia sp. GAS199]
MARIGGLDGQALSSTRLYGSFALAFSSDALPFLHNVGCKLHQGSLP